MKKKYIDLAKADFYLIDEKKVSSLLPEIKKVRHKYAAGFVVGISGSLGMEGAANLSAKAALRSGAGIVKLFIQDYCKTEKTKQMTDEIVKIDFDYGKKEEILSVCNKAKAVFIGPGIGRSKEINDFLLYLLPKITSSVVLDADGLYFFSNNLECHLPEKIVMTPHKKEMLKLLKKENNLSDQELLSLCQDFCEKYNTFLVLKGPCNFIFCPSKKPLIITKGDPGMATAGVGDVLTGVITALIAQGLCVYEGAVLGTYLHGFAGEIAAKEKTSYSLIASDIIEHLPDAFKEVIGIFKKN